MKWKAFFIIFKGRSVKQIKEILLEGESPTLMWLKTYANKISGNNLCKMQQETLIGTSHCRCEISLLWGQLKNAEN